jgi:hypothetical protein
LSDGLGSTLNFEVNAPNIAVLQLSVLEEAIVTTIQWRSPVGLAAIQHVGIVPIEWAEGLCKLVKVQSSVTILLIPRHEKFDFFSSRVDTDCTETFSDVI